MENNDTASDYRTVTLVGREPPADVRRHAEMIPGETGRYARIVRYRHAATKTIYEVLHFKAGRPPTREEVLADLRGDLEQLDRATEELEKTGRISAWIDRTFFAGASPSDIEKKRNDILDTIKAVEENYEPGEAVQVP